MKTPHPFIAASFMLLIATGVADIQKIKEGGVSIDLSDILTLGEPAVLVFHASWDQASIQLLEEIESWSERHSDLHIVFIDVIDPRTQVYRQFSLPGIPAIMVYDRRHEQVGGIVTDLDALETVLEDNRII